MVGSHTPKGKSIGGIGGAIEHTEVAMFEIHHYTETTTQILTRFDV